MLRSKLTCVLPIVALLALAACAPAQDEVPPTLEEGLARIRALGDELRWDEVLELAEALVEAYPDSAEAVLWRGTAHDASGDAEAARADLERAVELDPSDLSAQYRLALARVSIFDLEAFEAALRAFADLCADAIEADPEDPEPYLWRGRALRYLWEVPGAEADLRRAVELDPDNADALFSLAGVLRADRRAEAIELLERVVELRPHDVTARERLASRYDREGRYAEAIEQCELSAEINPDRGYPYGLMAFVCWTNLGDIDGALAAVEQGLEVEPTNLGCWTIKARILLEGRGDAQAALDALDQAQALVADDLSLQVSRSLALQELGRNEEALQVLSDAIERMPDGYTYLTRLVRAKLLYRMQRYAEAWQDMQVMEAEADRYGLTAHLDLLDQLREAMPEPPANTGDAQQTTEEGN